MEEHLSFIEQAISLAIEGVNKGNGGPFGAIVVKNGQIVGKGNNSVTSNNDPTAHAEVIAIRDACKTLGTFQLNGCVLYTSCEPCPMCLGAIYWARLDRVYYSATRHVASHHGFDDSLIYEEVARPINQRKIDFVQLAAENGIKPFSLWRQKEDKIKY
ncbi:MAG: nucleoside deaminase [Bacteroidales bacterium]|nr:nucleoside deaminase [Bacteroidales bacterium]MBN2750423.1 nucleoside deaminase [Bacteroidales bacterium]